MADSKALEHDDLLVCGFIRRNQSDIPDPILNIILVTFRQFARFRWELFDILHYLTATQFNIARTFFIQIINELKLSHKANIFYRDLSPQNILLDSNLNLMISRTPSCGDEEARRYMAPDLLSDENYEADAKCDIFSVGVILFIFLTGYPPFEVAASSDKWFKPLTKGKIEEFWRAHHKSQIMKDEAAKDLLTKMLCPDPLNRISIAQIQQHEWFKGPSLSNAKLIEEICKRNQSAEKKRRKDVRKMNDLAQSLIPWPIWKPEGKLELFPKNEIECMFGEVYTYLYFDESRSGWTHLYGLLEEAIRDPGKGTALWNAQTESLECEMNVAVSTQAKESKFISMAVGFKIKIYESRYWKNKYLEALAPQEIKDLNLHQILIVRITRIKGASFGFEKLKRSFILTYCSSILKGLPAWAAKMESRRFK